jgi:hypothetical protein
MTFKEAVNSNDAEKWLQIMNEELDPINWIKKIYCLGANNFFK